MIITSRWSSKEVLVGLFTVLLSTCRKGIIYPSLEMETCHPCGQSPCTLFTLSLRALNHADDGCVPTQAALQPLVTLWSTEAIRFIWTHQGTAKAKGLQRKKSPACCCREGGERVAGKGKKPPENLPYLQEHLRDTLALSSCCLHPHKVAFWGEEHWIPDGNSCSLVNWPICEQWLWLESTVVTCELPCQCANTGCLNGQKKSSKHQTFQLRVRFLSAVLPASAVGSWKRMCKQCSSKYLTCLEVVCCVLADSTSHVLSQTLTMYKVHDPCSSHPAGLTSWTIPREVLQQFLLNLVYYTVYYHTVCMSSRGFPSGMMCYRLLWLSVSTELFCRRMLMWNGPVRWGCRKKVEVMQIVCKYVIWMWWGSISSRQGFYRLCSKTWCAKCSHLHVINTLATLSMLHFSPLSPLNEDPSSILAILTKNDSREICINTWYLLLVSTECTTMSQPLSCSSRQLWLLSHTGALLSCHTAGLLLFTFALQVFCDLLCSNFPAHWGKSLPQIRYQGMAPISKVKMWSNQNLWEYSVCVSQSCSSVAGVLPDIILSRNCNSIQEYVSFNSSNFNLSL